VTVADASLGTQSAGGAAGAAPYLHETELGREMGLVSALAIGIGTMIAAGIFTLSGIAVRDVGSSAVIAFLLAAVAATFTALTYCEFSSIYPDSGEAYLYSRRTFAPPLAYFVGWALLLGYVSSCAFYIVSLSSYFNEFIWRGDLEAAPGIAILVFLALVNVKGTKESGVFQVVVTAGKILLLIWFVAGGLPHLSVEDVLARAETDSVLVMRTAGMVFITFFGFSAIAASAGEIRNPAKVIPRAIFISMAVVTVLYTLVVLVIIAAKLTDYGEAAMGDAARMFLGPVGGSVIVGGALFSMTSASNASIMAGSRVLYSMSRLGHLPRGMGVVHVRTRTPIVAIALVSLGIMVFSLLLPLEDLAHFADTLLLVALTFVNVALILHRRRYPDLERPFRVRLVPLVPILGVVANLYLLYQISHDVVPFSLAGASLAVGLLLFVAWQGNRAELEDLPGEASRVAMTRPAPEPGRFRILVPISEPALTPAIIDVAAALAANREGEIIAVRVAIVPEQIQPSVEDARIERERRLLDAARSRAAERGIACTSILRVGHHLARAILETAGEHECDVIVLAWKGSTSTARRLLGEDVDAILRLARCHVVVARFAPEASEQPIRKLFLSTAGGPHATLAEEYAVALAGGVEGGSITLGIVAPVDASEAQVSQAEKYLEEAEERIGDRATVHRQLIRHNSVAVGIIEASADCDAVVIGAAGSGRRRRLSGTIPELVARHSRRTALIVKRYQPVVALLRRLMER